MNKNDGYLPHLTFSEKRKEILFLLQESPKTHSDIKDHFDVTSPEIAPRIREMGEKGLIKKEERTYQLTEIGTLLAKQLKPLLDTVQALDNAAEFWTDHDLSVIPGGLLDRIGDLKESMVISDDRGHIYDSHKTFTDNVLKSKRFVGVTSIYLAPWIKMFLEMARKGIEISIIVTEGVYEKIIEDHPCELGEGLAHGGHMYVIPHVNIAFAATDTFFSLSLYRKDGIYDPINDLVCFDPEAIRWGNTLFEYYKENAIEVKSALQIEEIEKIEVPIPQ